MNEVKQLREGMGLSQHHVARITGHSQGFISMIERGRVETPATDKVIQKLRDLQEQRGGPQTQTPRTPEKPLPGIGINSILAPDQPARIWATKAALKDHTERDLQDHAELLSRVKRLENELKQIRQAASGGP